MIGALLRLVDRHLGIALLIPAMATVAVFAVWPVAQSMWSSLHRSILVLPVEAQFVGLDNYRRLLSDAVALRSAGVTLLFVGGSVAGELLLGLLLALLMHRAMPARGVYRALVLVPWAMPTVVAAQMWRLSLHDRYGLVNLLLFGDRVDAYVAPLVSPGGALLALVVADVWKTASFAGLLLLAGLQMIPDDLYEAARIDGATAWQQFRWVTLPMLRPAILVAALFRTLDAFRVFDLVYVLTYGGPGDATNTLQFYGYRTLMGESAVGYGSAIVTVVFFLALAVSIVYIRVVGSSLLEREAR
jgi:multiple sugar transport system permease protein